MPEDLPRHIESVFMGQVGTDGAPQNVWRDPLELSAGELDSKLGPLIGRAEPTTRRPDEGPKKLVSPTACTPGLRA